MGVNDLSIMGVNAYLPRLRRFRFLEGPEFIFGEPLVDMVCSDLRSWRCYYWLLSPPAIPNGLWRLLTFSIYNLQRQF
jgi:hypothetical protein